MNKQNESDTQVLLVSHSSRSQFFKYIKYMNCINKIVTLKKGFKYYTRECPQKDFIECSFPKELK